MTDETIQEDVSGASEAGEAQTPEATPTETPEESGVALDHLTDRERKIAAMHEKRQEEIEEGRKAAAEMAGDDQAAAEGAGDTDMTGEAPPADAAPPSEPAANGWSTGEDGKRVKRLNVNGQIVELTEEQYDRQVQKDLAGDEKLRQAAEREKALEQREQQLRQQQQNLQETPPPSAEGAADVEKLIGEYTDAIYEGDADAAKEKMKEILASGRSATPNMDDLAEQVATRVETRQEEKRHRSSVESAWDSFQTDHPDIAGHPGKLAYADAEVKRLRQENPDLVNDPGKLFAEAGRLTAEAFGPSPAPAGDKGEQTTSADRKERKAKLTPIPRTGSQGHKPPAETPVDNSPQAKIARMRKGRMVG